METRISRIEFEHIDSGEIIVIERFRFSDMPYDDVFRIWNRAYKRAEDYCGINKISKNVRMIKFETIE